MRPIVVEDEMHVQLRWDRRLNRVEKRAELTAALPLVQLPDHLARLHVQGRKQRSRPVTPIVVRAPLDLPGAHRQQWPCAVQCLNLGFLIHAQHQRFVRRIHVQANNIPDFLDKERVLREFEGFGPMRLQPEGSPDTADGALTEAAGLRHVPAAPMGGCLGCRLQRQRQEPLHRRIAGASRGAGVHRASRPAGARRSAAASG